MKAIDHKTKSITMLVRSLMAATLLIVVLAIALVYYLYSATVVHIADQPKRFVCGTCEDLRRKREYSSSYGNSPQVNGKMLFKANCSSCHTMTDRKSTGPGLWGVPGRIPGGEWKYYFVRNHDSMVAAGDPYAVALFERYKVKATSFPKLTNDEIDAILSYSN